MKSEDAAGAWRRVAGLCLSSLWLTATLAVADGDSMLMPADGTINGWSPSGRARVFTQADLYGYIDGGAELFFELGFEELTVQGYRRGADEITVELYRMTDSIAARGIYLMKCGHESPDPTLAERHTANPYQVMLQRQRYYLVVNNDSGGETVARELVEFASYVAAKLPPDQPVSCFDLLPPEGLDRASVRLFRGPVGLQSVYTLGEGDILQLDGRHVAVSGVYAGAGAHTRIVVEYADAEAARRAFVNVQRNLDRYLTLVSSDTDRLAFQDYEKKYGVISLAGKRLEIRVHVQVPPGP